MSDDCLINFSWMSNQCLINVLWMSDDCFINVSSMSYAYLVSVWSMSYQCLMDVWWLSNQCLMNVLSWMSYADLVSVGSMSYQWPPREYLSTTMWVVVLSLSDVSVCGTTTWVSCYSLLHLQCHFSNPKTQSIIYVSFATFRWQETNSIEIGEWDWMIGEWDWRTL